MLLNVTKAKAATVCLYIKCIYMTKCVYSVNVQWNKAQWKQIR